jgi:hypothetical protein
LLPPLLAAIAFAIGLAVILLSQGFRAGTPESLLLAWMLVFVIGLPLLVLVLALASRIGTALQRHHIIPLPGDNIPRLGQ